MRGALGVTIILLIVFAAGVAFAGLLMAEVWAFHALSGLIGWNLGFAVGLGATLAAWTAIFMLITWIKGRLWPASPYAREPLTDEDLGLHRDPIWSPPRNDGGFWS